MNTDLYACVRGAIIPGTNKNIGEAEIITYLVNRSLDSSAIVTIDFSSINLKQKNKMVTDTLKANSFQDSQFEQLSTQTKTGDFKNGFGVEIPPISINRVVTSSE